MFTIFSYRISEKQILIAILLLGALLRFWGLGSAEIFHDEGLYAFRSIGYFDYIQNDAQTTPVQWFKGQPNLPWWTPLSFHDHPPLFFLIQHLFFNLFGDSLLVARLPSALAGIASIYLVYLIFRRSDLVRRILTRSDLQKLERGHVGLLAALLLAVNHIHIWISRSSFLESLLFFLILLNIYYFLNFLTNQKTWKMFGITLGLAFLTKYTSFFLVPVYFFYLIFISIFGTSDFRIFKNWRLYAAFGLTVLLFSPVLIYNFYLWQTVGHFDLQFAYLFRQATPEWQASLGKIQEPFFNILENLSSMYSISFLLAAIFGIVCSIGVFIKNFRANLRFNSNSSAIVFGWLTLIFVTLTLIPTGSAFRFITLYLFPFLFLTALAFLVLRKKLAPQLFKILFVIFILYELYFSIDGIFLTFPDFGVAKLDAYLEESIGGQRSLRLPQSPNPHLNDIIKRYGRRRPAADESLVIVYDENIALSSKLWLFTRRLYYQGILAVTAGQFKTLLQNQGLEAFDRSRVYFVKATENTSLNPKVAIKDAEELENFLMREFNLRLEKVISNRDGLPMFLIYKFLL